METATRGSSLEGSLLRSLQSTEIPERYRQLGGWPVGRSGQPGWGRWVALVPTGHHEMIRSNHRHARWPVIRFEWHGTGRVWGYLHWEVQ